MSVPAKPYLSPIHCIEDLLIRLESVQSDQRILFRGVRQEYALLPKLARNDVSNVLLDANPYFNLSEIERLLLGRFKRYGSRFVRNARFLKPIEWLCIAQHYRLPTFLLDWSLDPLVSLYFACTESARSKEANHNALLYMMSLHRRSDRPESTYYIGETDESIEKLAGPPLIIPMLEDPRINAQSGRFIYAAPHFLKRTHRNEIPPDLMDAGWDKKKVPWKQIYRYLIPHDAKARIKKQLDSLHVHGGRVFPELQQYADYLARGGL